MRWQDICAKYPEQWLIIEALEAHTEENQRHLDQITVVELCPDGMAAFSHYQQLHQRHPVREFYFVHTARETLDIRERQWLGIRRKYEAQTA